LPSAGADGGLRFYFDERDGSWQQFGCSTEQRSTPAPAWLVAISGAKENWATLAWRSRLLLHQCEDSSSWRQASQFARDYGRDNAFLGAVQHACGRIARMVW